MDPPTAAQPFPWAHYLHTAVEFYGHGTVYPLDDGAIGGSEPPLLPGTDVLAEYFASE